MFRFPAVLMFVFALVWSGTASATIITSFGSLTTEKAAFNATATATGATVTEDVWSSIAINFTEIARPGYTVTPNDGQFNSLVSPLSGSNRLNGWGVPISPFTLSAGGSNPRLDPLAYEVSGATFTFDNPVNGIGFEMDDWATCCFDPTTDIFLSFDGGAPILLATADQFGDGEFFDDRVGGLRNVMFVTAFDDSGTFSEVSVWGNGLGEALRMGGEVRYTTVPIGSLPGGETTPMPLPSLLSLMMGAVSFLVLTRSRSRRVR